MVPRLRLVRPRLLRMSVTKMTITIPVFKIYTVTSKYGSPETDQNFINDKNIGWCIDMEKAVLWLRRLVASLSHWRSGFAPRSVHVGFVADKVAVGQVFLRVLRFSLSISFHRGSPRSYIISVINNRPVGGRS
jgi:hypothetical protein